MSIEPCIRGITTWLDYFNIEISYATGHSLGGALATIHHLLHPTTIKHGVVTFGAPKTSEQSCSVPGKRYCYKMDAVCGDMFVLDTMGYHHDVQNAYSVQEVEQCEYKVFGLCVYYGQSKCGKPSKEADCNYQSMGGLPWAVTRTVDYHMDYANCDW